ncbi:fimbrial protein [Siccibacter colletis]|uniref:fimbrial protein n=1 Tax=Siccibacter colletis TaxID=1505757 RepID=UPI003CE70DCA
MKKVNFHPLMKSFCTGLITLLISAPSVADPVSINVTGNIIAAPCEVSSDSINKTIALDGGNGFQATDFQAAGAASSWVTFDITLKNCPEGTTATIITFSGTPDSDHPEDMYANSGTAKNVAVQLQGSGGHQFGNGKSFTNHAISDGISPFHLKTRAYTNKGGVTPGTIQAVVTANFTYQ